MGNSTFKQIEKKYGQNGVDYITFRYHERQCYKRIKQSINTIKQHATDDQNAAVATINAEKAKLKEEFDQAKMQVEAQKSNAIGKAEADNRGKIESFSGFDDQNLKLERLIQNVNAKYKTQKTEVQKKIKEDVMRRLNKSKLKAVAEFDSKSDKARKQIQDECILAYPLQKPTIDTSQEEGIIASITWQSYKKNFDSIFNQNKFLDEAKQGRKNVKDKIMPTNQAQCC